MNTYTLSKNTYTLSKELETPAYYYEFLVAEKRYYDSFDTPPEIIGIYPSFGKAYDEVCELCKNHYVVEKNIDEFTPYNINSVCYSDPLNPKHNYFIITVEACRDSERIYVTPKDILDAREAAKNNRETCLY